MMAVTRRSQIIHPTDLSAELHSRVTRGLLQSPGEWSPPWKYWDAHREECLSLAEEYQKLYEAYGRCSSDEERERILQQAIELLRKLPWERVVRSPLV